MDEPLSAPALTSIVLEANNVLTIEDFKEWTRRCLRPLFPHESLVSGLGHMHSAGVSLDYAVVVDCPLAYLRSLRNRAGGLKTPIMERWLQVREPVFLNAETPWPDLPVSWLLLFREYDLRNVIAHGRFDEDLCIATYHSFFRLPGPVGDVHAAMLRQLLPVMHDVLAKVISHIENSDPVSAHQSPLTARETQVAHGVRLGKTNSEIGTILGVSENTVKHHLTSIFRKFHTQSRTGLIYLLEEREIPAPPRWGTRIF